MSTLSASNPTQAKAHTADQIRDTVIPAGEAAPDFELPTQNRGETWRLSDALKRGEVVLSFFPMAFTGVCAAEMQCVTNDMERWRGKGAQVVGISGDSGPALKAWADQLALKQTLLSDIHRTVCKEFGLYWAEMNLAWRGTVVIGRDARVKWSQKREIAQAMRLDEVIDQLS
ncbi:peroxiredoxin [soil metagenome]